MHLADAHSGIPSSDAVSQAPDGSWPVDRVRPVNASLRCIGGAVALGDTGTAIDPRSKRAAEQLREEGAHIPLVSVGRASPTAERG
jgi:hypothetical protein